MALAFFSQQDLVDGIQGMAFFQILVGSVLLIDIDQVNEDREVAKAVPISVDCLTGRDFFGISEGPK